jgi:hypothetical protein
MAGGGSKLSNEPSRMPKCDCIVASLSRSVSARSPWHAS